LRLVLDANEYIFGLGLFRKQSSESLVVFIIDNLTSHSVSVCRTIVEEVRTNLTPKEFQGFIRFINALTTIDEDFFIPFELGARYEAMGFKEADALIAAYTDWVGADALVTENRHFLRRSPSLPFKVINARQCLDLISKAS
jgi:uncharacterized protein (DUF2164 family)